MHGDYSGVMKEGVSKRGGAMSLAYRKKRKPMPPKPAAAGKPSRPAQAANPKANRPMYRYGM